jgi:hypothetical protein
MNRHAGMSPTGGKIKSKKRVKSPKKRRKIKKDAIGKYGTVHRYRRGHHPLWGAVEI